MTSDRGAALRRKWRENHGPVLVGFALLVLMIGSGLLMYRQRGIRSSTAAPKATVARPLARPAADSEPAAADERLPAGELPARENPPELPRLDS